MLNIRKAKMIAQSPTDSVDAEINNQVDNLTEHMRIYQSTVLWIADSDFYFQGCRIQPWLKKHAYDNLNSLALKNPDEFISFLAQEETLEDVDQILTCLKPETEELIRSLLSLRINSNIPSLLPLVQSQMEKVPVLSQFPPGVLPVGTSYLGTEDIMVMASPATLFHPRNLVLQQMYQVPALAAFPSGLLPLIAESVGHDVVTSSFDNSNIKMF